MMVSGRNILKIVGVAGLALVIGQGCSQKSVRTTADSETFEQGAAYADNQPWGENAYGQGNQPFSAWQGSAGQDHQGWSQDQNGQWQYGAGLQYGEGQGGQAQQPAQAYIDGAPQDEAGDQYASQQRGGLSYFGSNEGQSWSNGSLGGLQEYGDASGQWGQDGNLAQEFIEQDNNHIAEAQPFSGFGRGGQYGRNSYGDQHSRVQVELQDVFFEFDSWRINQDGMQSLAHDADWIAQNHNRTLTVEGHCDQRGTRDYNLVLGKKRAEAVRTYLVDLGVEAHKIQVISYGKERPFCFGSDEQCYQLNRRGHLQLHH